MGNLTIPPPPPKPSGPALAMPDLHRQQIAAHYARAQSIIMVLVQVAIVVLFLTVFNPLNPAWSAALRDWARSVTADPGGVVALYTLALAGLWIGLMLPVTFVSGYVLPRRYGLVTQRLGGWTLDYAKATAFTLAIWVAAVAVLYWLVRTLPGWWWLFAAVLLWLAYVAAEYLTPVVIWPLFTKMRPLDDPELSRRLKALAERAGAPVLGIFVLDWSSRATHANAWLAGLGRTRRIVLADTLLHGFTYDELEAIMAHELAHHVHRDIARQLAVRAGLVLASFMMAWWMLRVLANDPPLEGPADVATLPIVLLAFMVQAFFTGTLGNYMSRRAETAADLFAMRLTDNADAFRSSMIKLGDRNLTEMNPAVWSVATGHTHPVTAERVALAERVAGRPPSAVTVGSWKQDGRWFARVALSWGVPVLAGVAIAFWSIGSGLAGYGGARTVTDGSERGPSAVWSEHLAMARLRAAQIDPGAVLYRVTAEPYGSADEWYRSDNLLDVTFEFVGREGTFWISTVDSKPPEIYYVSESIGLDELLQAGDPVPDRERAISRADYLRIKPRLALAATLPDAIRFYQKGHDYLYPYLELDLTTEDAEPAWVVVYSGTEKDLELQMDAKTGKLLWSEVTTPDY
jgi:STE24 endopeptidase